MAKNIENGTLKGSRTPRALAPVGEAHLRQRETRSQYSPVVRDGLCRKIRSKGMLVHIDEGPGKGSSRQAYLEIDGNALDYDGTVWWCTETSKTIGPDDRPCDETRCGSSKRACYRGEEPVA